jgi:hypothetical protein
VEQQVEPCKKKRTLKLTLLLLLHHLIVIFNFFGFLKYPLFAIYVIVIIKTFWIFNNNTCKLTIIDHEYCGIDKNKKMTNLFSQLLIKDDIANSKNMIWYNLLGLLILIMGYSFTTKKIQYIYLSILATFLTIGQIILESR